MSVKPKRPGSAFLLFSSDNRSKFKESHPQATVTEVSAGLGEQWKKMTDKEKKKYNDEYAKQKAAYEKELKKYNDSRTPEDIQNEKMNKRKDKKDKGKKKKHKDPNAPKRPMSGYMFFTQEMRKQLPNMTVTEQAKELGARWATLTDGQKEKYQKQAEKDKKRYQAELAEYNQ